ncbi:PilW family protein [Psychromonas sp. PT13]|uniref:PilW family protein n=1 Tax=Psychromonas sp. PT13 TaxID=3439547 RepID=UPI003EBF27F5
MLKINAGFSLVEMLISLLLGGVLLAMVVNLYVISVATGTKNLKYSRLRADIQSIMYMMETDIRRAGYGGRAFMVGSGANKTVDTINTDSQNCIVYYYNHDDSSSITSANRMGIRLKPSSHEIQFGTGLDPLAANCYDSGYWKALSDKEFIKITELRFTESVVSNANATFRSVKIEINSELTSESTAKYSQSTKVQVRNPER